MNLPEDIIDSHTHIDFARFNHDRKEVIRRARISGVREIINSGIDHTTNNTTLLLSKEYSFIHPTLGLSPNRVAGLNKKALSAVVSQITAHLEEISGIGEVGLDHYHCKDARLREKQQCVFQKILELATTLDKPLILHARCAEETALDLVCEQKCVVFHCYSGSTETMKRIIDSGFYISLSTLVCFSKHHQQLAEEVPLRRLLVETDSPFLSPRRGRNEPAYIVDAVNAIAKAKNTTPSKVARATTENAKKIFHIKN
jgi:TatD DNase family protein